MRLRQAPGITGVFAHLLVGCTPLLELEGPARDGAVVTLDDGLPTPLDAELTADTSPDAAPMDAEPPPPPPDAAPSADATRPDAAVILTGCPAACAHLGACLARPDVCPALRSIDRDALVASCDQACTDDVAQILLDQPCETIPELLGPLTNALPMDCLLDTAPLPRGVAAEARFTRLTPVSAAECPVLAGDDRGASFARLAAFGGWNFDLVLVPAIAGVTAPALVVVFEGWSPGATGNQAGGVMLGVWTGTSDSRHGAVDFETQVAALPGWLNGARVTSAPGPFDLPVPALPAGYPLRMPLEQAEIQGDLVIVDAGVRVNPAYLTGYITRAGMVEYALRLQRRCALPDPLLFEFCTRMTMTLGLLRTAEQVAEQLWALVPPDTRLPEDGGAPQACDDDCNAASVCLLGLLGPPAQRD